MEDSLITISKAEYIDLISISEHRRQALANAFQTFEKVKALGLGIDLSKMKSKIALIPKIMAIINDESKQAAIAEALGMFASAEYLNQLKELSHDN